MVDELEYLHSIVYVPSHFYVVVLSRVFTKSTCLICVTIHIIRTSGKFLSSIVFGVIIFVVVPQQEARQRKGAKFNHAIWLTTYYMNPELAS